MSSSSCRSVEKWSNSFCGIVSLFFSPPELKGLCIAFHSVWRERERVWRKKIFAFSFQTEARAEMIFSARGYIKKDLTLNAKKREKSSDTYYTQCEKKSQAPGAKYRCLIRKKERMILLSLVYPDDEIIAKRATEKLLMFRYLRIVHCTLVLCMAQKGSNYEASNIKSYSGDPSFLPCSGLVLAKRGLWFALILCPARYKGGFSSTFIYLKRPSRPCSFPWSTSTFVRKRTGKLSKSRYKNMILFYDRSYSQTRVL